jgi:hypothetical protein
MLRGAVADARTLMSGRATQYRPLLAVRKISMRLVPKGQEAKGFDDWNTASDSILLMAP